MRLLLIGVFIIATSPASAFCLKATHFDAVRRLEASLEYLECVQNEQAGLVNDLTRLSSTQADEISDLNQSIDDLERKVRGLQREVDDLKRAGQEKEPNGYLWAPAR